MEWNVGGNTFNKFNTFNEFNTLKRDLWRQRHKRSLWYVNYNVYCAAILCCIEIACGFTMGLCRTMCLIGQSCNYIEIVLHCCSLATFH